MHVRSIHGILEGRKTQTRRIIKPRGFCLVAAGPDWSQWYSDKMACQVNQKQLATLFCPYGQVGDRLWVRETWAMNDVHYGWGSIPKTRPSKFGGLVYRADGDWKDQFAELDGDIPPWRPSIFMPRWASRLTLEITNIRVERVQDISEEDCGIEGIRIEELPPDPDNFHPPGSYGYISGKHPEGTGPIWPKRKEAFRELWDETNGTGAWDRNDWVWCVSFRKLEAQ